MLLFHSHNVLNLVKKPAVNLGELADGFNRNACGNGFLDTENAVPLRDAAGSPSILPASGGRWR